MIIAYIAAGILGLVALLCLTATLCAPQEVDGESANG